MAKHVKCCMLTRRDEYDEIAAYYDWLAFREGVYYDNLLMCDEKEEKFQIMLEKKVPFEKPHILVFASDGTIAGKFEILNLWHKFTEKFDKEYPDAGHEP